MRTFNLTALYLLMLGPIAGQETTINWDAPMGIDAAETGYSNLRMELDPDGNPIVLHGKSGSAGGLYCSRWNGAGFDDATAVTAETGIFINDSEGPRMAVSGNKVVVAHQISGEWDTGGRVVISEDGGQTWGDPIAVAPEATEDHFMPVPALDADGDPWVALKWGNAPALEGVLDWNEEEGAFNAATDAGAVLPGDAVCECCASMPFIIGDQRYNLVRNNNNNVRDFHLLRANGDGVWTESLDVDPTNWLINSCPASEAEVALLGDGNIAAVFMSAAEGGSRTYWSTIDPAAWTLLGSDRIEPTLDFNENNPSVSADGDHAVAAWERSDGGYNVMVGVGANTAAGMAQWTANAASTTEALSGHSRKPVIRLKNGVVHLVYQRASDALVHYLQGTIETAGTDRVQAAEWMCAPTESGWRIAGTQGTFQWRLYDLSGRSMASGNSTDQRIACPLEGAAILEVVADGRQQAFKVFR